ncbi:MAG: sulfite exporter TauE/SafE family protein [Colwellia sp.]|nr:sulfite exporter TauE/SafE family protein [Colwellia sp.]
MTLDYFSAFVIGLIGSAHCVGMCGGIASMLTTALSKQNKTSNVTLVFLYNTGRIFSYALIGAIVGYTGSTAARNMGIPLAGLRLVAAIFLIFLGLYLGQWLMWITRIETLGKILWQKISPLSKSLIPVDTPLKALGLGALWGWLPCGLVYSTLTWSMASGNALSGALIMLCFGLGTLPALVLMSLSTIKIKQFVNQPFLRKTLAFGIILYGIYSLIVAYHLLF